MLSKVIIWETYRHRQTTKIIYQAAATRFSNSLSCPQFHSLVQRSCTQSCGHSSQCEHDVRQRKYPYNERLRAIPLTTTDASHSTADSTLDVLRSVMCRSWINFCHFSNNAQKIHCMRLCGNLDMYRCTCTENVTTVQLDSQLQTNPLLRSLQISWFDHTGLGGHVTPWFFRIWLIQLQCGSQDDISACDLSSAKFVTMKNFLCLLLASSWSLVLAHVYKLLYTLTIKALVSIVISGQSSTRTYVNDKCGINCNRM